MTPTTFSLDTGDDPLGGWRLRSPFDCTLLRRFLCTFLSHPRTMGLAHGRLRFSRHALERTAQDLGRNWDYLDNNTLALLREGNRGLVALRLPRDTRGWMLLPSDVEIHERPPSASPSLRRAWIRNVLESLGEQAYHGTDPNERLPGAFLPACAWINGKNHPEIQEAGARFLSFLPPDRQASFCLMGMYPDSTGWKPAQILYAGNPWFDGSSDWLDDAITLWKTGLFLTPGSANALVSYTTGQNGQAVMATSHNLTPEPGRRPSAHEQLLLSASLPEHARQALSRLA